MKVKRCKGIDAYRDVSSNAIIYDKKEQRSSRQDDKYLNNLEKRIVRLEQTIRKLEEKL